MAERPATNASPLIFLSRASLINLLQLIADEIIVPETVAEEILRRGENDVTAQTISKTPWLNVMPTPPVPSSIQAWGLGAGESAVLSWAYANPDTEVIIDDLAARRCATTFGIPVRGTLGIVLIAKQRGEISSARDVLEKLRQAGMYLSDKVLNQALVLIGE